MLLNVPRSTFGGRVSLTKSTQCSVPARYASLNSAIGRGIRRSQPGETSSSRSFDERDGRRRVRRDDYQYQSKGQRSWPEKSFEKKPEKWHERRPERKPVSDLFDRDEFVRSGSFRTPSQGRDRGHSKSRSESRDLDSDISEKVKSFSRKVSTHGVSRAHRATASVPERVKENVKVPESIPYTSPASEFIYGTGAVEAALRSSRRQLYKLYLYQAAGEELSPTKVILRKLALSSNIEVKMAFAGRDRLLDKMSAGRPHNGCVLEASPLPKLPIRGFHPVQAMTDSHFRVELAPQTREEAAVNGTDDRISILHPPISPSGEQRYRYPVCLLLDGVVDPGNLGAIIRSAYYLGIDTVVFAGRNSAPLSPVTIKASAGAAENMSLLQVKNEIDFIQRSQNNGWKFYAADAPGPVPPIWTAYHVIMMGSEGSGLSSHIKSHADAIVSIPGARHSAHLGVESDPARIDSLNVSVAAALLMETFLRTPLGVSEPARKGKGQRMW
ncbi:uncharacterized protein N7477_009975 [Penicillium maclennaniae]|uniref:uncharacterized protein n=1 Tax=Penicillium maclennaniae TaxID=1343394 RepID=UPI002541F64E|nr:uncharacterized protein N7477_009975 [Penicillium maclennaniae]KAJ5662359.1 hypothetical protein N7477_009975 [Penicillium maclennaniae]